jgi:hypothetical protein
MPERPRPTEAHQRLLRLAGTWEGTEDLSPSPFGPGGPATGRTVFRAAVDGFYLTGDYEETKGGAVSFRGHSVFGVDGASGEVVWFWFDSMGQPPPAPSRGRWDGDRLVLHATFPQGKGRYTYALDGPDRYRFTAEVALEGKPFATFMTGDYRRTG